MADQFWLKRAEVARDNYFLSPSLSRLDYPSFDLKSLITSYFITLIWDFSSLTCIFYTISSILQFKFASNLFKVLFKFVYFWIFLSILSKFSLSFSTLSSASCLSFSLWACISLIFLSIARLILLFVFRVFFSCKALLWLSAAFSGFFCVLKRENYLWDSLRVLINSDRSRCVWILFYCFFERIYL